MLKDWNELYRSGEYLQRWDHRSPSSELVEAFIGGLFPTGGVFVDLGCGTGIDAAFIASRGYTSIGIDISLTALTIASRLSDNVSSQVHWIGSDALALPIQTGSIDVFSDRGCLHHVDMNDWQLYFNELERVLAPDGRAFIRGSDSAWDGYFSPVNKESINIGIHGKHLSLNSIRSFNMLSDAGNLSANIVILSRATNPAPQV